MNPTNPGALLHRLRWSLLRNTLRVLWQRSMVRLLTIVGCSLVIWAVIFFAAERGFRELDVRWRLPLDGGLVLNLLYFLFFSLTALLIFSTAIILHSSLFSSPECQFLLHGPIPDDHIFAYKFQGAVGFSSWAFVLLGSPILLGYGIHVSGGAPWYFYPLLPVFFLGFVLLPGSIGALLTLTLVNILPRKRKQALALMIVLGAAVLAVVIYRFFADAAEHTVGGRAWFETLMQQLSSLAQRAVPIEWMSRGIQKAAVGEIGSAGYYLALIWSQGLMLYLLAVAASRWLYRRGFNRLATGGDFRRRFGGSWMDRILETLLFFTDKQTRLLLVKDFRTFRRDPAQFFQTLIFLGLVALYFSLVRRFYEQDLGSGFQSGVSLLTLVALSFMVCAYTGRFVFPMLSLEGRKFWILGLLPLPRERLLWGKFLFSATWCTVTMEAVVLLSDVLLGMPLLIMLVHVLTLAVLSLGLSGLSVGLGALMPNFRETDPSKIAVGFGGTLNLVAGLFFLLVVIGVMAVPFHLLTISGQQLWAGDVPWWAWAGLGLGVVLGAVCTILPLRAGARNLRNMEF